MPNKRIYVSCIFFSLLLWYCFDLLNLNKFEHLLPTEMVYSNKQSLFFSLLLCFPPSSLLPPSGSESLATSFYLPWHHHSSEAPKPSAVSFPHALAVLTSDLCSLASVSLSELESLSFFPSLSSLLESTHVAWEGSSASCFFFFSFFLL